MYARRNVYVSHERYACKVKGCPAVLKKTGPYLRKADNFKGHNHMEQVILMDCADEGSSSSAMPDNQEEDVSNDLFENIVVLESNFRRFSFVVFA